MTCFHPLTGYYSSQVNPTGKRSLQFKPQGSHSGVGLKLPCGKCLGCKLERSRVWAVRLMHENKMHSESCFVTWTYSNDCLPTAGSLVPTDLQSAHKRLHNRLLDKRGYGIRYYGCGEYGDKNQRPHYHSLIFGFRPSDGKYFSENDRGEVIYDSEFLVDVWGRKGAARFGEVSFESAAYVARYCTKKVDGALRDAGHYVVYDSDGLIHERAPEFSQMSLRPGIGANYFAKYGNEIATHDSVVVNGREAPSIRYYDKLIERGFVGPVSGRFTTGLNRIDVLKRNRQRKVLRSERRPDRMRVKEILLIKRHKLKERQL